MPLRNGERRFPSVWWGTFETGDLYATSDCYEPSNGRAR
jgi:hypothetical protein